MRAFKLLDADRRAPFTRVTWTPGSWVQATRAIPCREGVHACLARDVAHWLAPSLWEVELDSEIVERRHTLVASRGRLVRRIEACGDAVRELAEVGAWRCGDRAVRALVADSAAELADRWATTLEDLAAPGAGVTESSHAGAAAALAAVAAPAPAAASGRLLSLPPAGSGPCGRASRPRGR